MQQDVQVLNEENDLEQTEEVLSGKQLISNLRTKAQAATMPKIIKFKVPTEEMVINFQTAFYINNANNLPDGYEYGDKFDAIQRKEWQEDDGIIISDLVGEVSTKNYEPEALLKKLCEQFKDIPKEKVILGFNSANDERLAKVTGVNVGKLLFEHLGISDKWVDIDYNLDPVGKLAGNPVWPVIEFEIGPKKRIIRCPIAVVETMSDRFQQNEIMLTRNLNKTPSGDMRIGIGCSVSAIQNIDGKCTVLLNGYKRYRKTVRKGPRGNAPTEHRLKISVEKNPLYNPKDPKLCLEPKYKLLVRFYNGPIETKFSVAEEYKQLKAYNEAIAEVLKESISQKLEHYATIEDRFVKYQDDNTNEHGG